MIRRLSRLTSWPLAAGRFIVTTDQSSVIGTTLVSRPSVPAGFA